MRRIITENVLLLSHYDGYRLDVTEAVMVSAAGHGGADKIRRCTSYDYLEGGIFRACTFRYTRDY